MRRRAIPRAVAANTRLAMKVPIAASNSASSETAPGDRLRSAEFRSNSFARYQGGGVYFGGLSPGTEMHIATWLVAVPWRNSFIGAFSGEFQNLRSDASSGKRTSAVRAPTGQLPSKT